MSDEKTSTETKPEVKLSREEIQDRLRELRRTAGHVAGMTSEQRDETLDLVVRGLLGL